MYLSLEDYVKIELYYDTTLVSRVTITFPVIVV